jgi:Ser-tRNA(Ala) deacylase AlaX
MQALHPLPQAPSTRAHGCTGTAPEHTTDMNQEILLNQHNKAEYPPTGTAPEHTTDMNQEILLNQHNKAEYPPMHTAEHILNQTMIRMFGCGRSRNAHIERKKSKCDYLLDHEPSADDMAEVERKVNEIIEQRLPVTISFLAREEAAAIVDLSKLPEHVSETLRIVQVGDYDACACIGDHVSNTSEIGRFKLLNYDYADRRLRLRFKLL